MNILYYWSGLGLIYPVHNGFLMSLLKSFLMLILFMVFLKTDVAQILTKMKNYRQMIFLALSFMIVIPLSFFFIINIFNQKLAVGIILLSSMPAAVASLITTSINAPFTVPLLFWLIQFKDLSVEHWWLFKDLVVIIILPVIATQAIKKFLSGPIKRNSHMFTSANIIILSLMVYAVMGSQRDVFFSNSIRILWQTAFLYLVFILLHIAGFFIGYAKDLKKKIATTIGSAYRNNGMAIVLATLYFEPSILILMVLTELPWNTCLIPKIHSISTTKTMNFNVKLMISTRNETKMNLLNFMTLYPNEK